MARIKRFPIVSLLALSMALPAIAQAPPAQPAPQAEPQAEPDQDRDVVVVTASKREETVQDIAVAVTAITSEMRDQIGLTTVQDYTNFAPGLSYSTTNDRLGMRGVTRTSNNFGIRSGISNYVDGVYFSSAIPASREPIFTERVEVVRGPQGTLYGRDSIGGALNVISKRPTDEFEGQFNIGGGSFDNLKVETTMAGPITDWLRYRVGASRTGQDEGFLTNYSGLETEGARRNDSYLEGQLEGDIGERFDWWVRVGSLNWDVRNGAPGARTGVGAQQAYNTKFYNSTADIAPYGFAGLTTPDRVQVGSQVTNPAITDRLGFNTDFTNYAKLSPTSELALEMVWHADNFDIKYLGGYVYYNYQLKQDDDDTPIKQFQRNNRTIFTERVSDYTENRGWYSNEINFLSTWDGPFQVVSGVYQYQENYNQTVFVDNVTNPGGPIRDATAVQDWLTLAGPFTGAPPPPALIELPTGGGRNSSSGALTPGGSLVFHTNNSAINNAYGAFLQGDYQVSDQIKLTAGVRYSKDISDGREYARIVNHYVVEDALESGFNLAYNFLPDYAGLRALLGPNAATVIGAVVPGAVPIRLDVTTSLGGADPSTVTATNPCGFAGQGVQNANVTTANGTPNAAGECRDQTRYGIYLDPTTGNRYRDMHATWEEVTGVLGIDWTPDTDTLVYGKYNRGYKPGGFGAADVYGILAPTPYTDQETVDAFELGFKRDWRDLNLITNATFFYYDYKGYQVSNVIVPPDPGGGGIRPTPYTAYVNLPETKTSGFELETIWNATDNLRFIFNYGYTNPEIGDSPALVHALDPFALDPAAQPLGAAAAAPATCDAPSYSPPGSGPAVCRGEQGQNLNGNILPFSPKNKIALNSTYTWDLADGAKIDASLSYFWQDIAFSSIFNRSYTKIPAWDQTDARLSWTNADGNITLIGFVQNVFDEIVYDSKGSDLREGGNNQLAPTLCESTPGTSVGLGVGPAQSCYTTDETLRLPRIWGAELQVRF